MCVCMHVDVYPFGSMRLPDVRSIGPITYYDLADRLPQFVVTGNRTGAPVGFRDVASSIHDPEMGDWPLMGGMGNEPKGWHGGLFPQEWRVQV